MLPKAPKADDDTALMVLLCLRRPSRCKRALGWKRWRRLRVRACRLALHASPRAPYVGRAWYDMPWAPRRVPLEPLFKVLLTFIGINGELWFGHESWRWACSWLLVAAVHLC